MVLAEWRYCSDTPSLSVTCHCLKLESYLLISCSQSAVLRGAALRGLEGLAPRIKHSRRHYGISASYPFRENIDPEDHAFLWYTDNSKYCSGRMKWLISKVSNASNGKKLRLWRPFWPRPANIVFIQGEKIILGTFRTSSWLRKYSPGVENTFEDTLYSCSLVDAPGYDDDPRTWPPPDKSSN
jgi:hypothetical protein